MTKTYIWEIISLLSGKDLKKFRKFLNSPAFNLRNDLIKLYEFLTKSRKNHKKNERLSRQKTFEYIFPGENYNDQKLRLTISRLKKKLEDFLILEELEKTPFGKERFLISAFRRRKFIRNFQNSSLIVKKRIETQPLRNSEYFYLKYFLEYQNYLYISEKGLKEGFNLKNIDKNLTISFMSNKLRQACFSLSHQAVSSKIYDIPLLDELMELANQPPYYEIPSILIYSNFVSLFKSSTNIKFNQFKEKLFLHKNDFTDEEFRDIYLAALNFCIKKINDNQKDYFSEALGLYKKGLNLGLLLNDGKLSRSTYNNIVGIALRIDDPEWVENFIQSYKNFLDTPYNITAFNLNMARLEFVKKNYRKALFHIQYADYDDLLNHMNAKILQVKIYYELDELETLHSLLKSMRAFIHRKRKIGYHYQLWKNIIRFTEKLIKVNHYDKIAVKTLADKIKREELLPEKEWLIEKLKN